MSGRIPAAIVAAIALLVSLPGFNNSFAHDDVLIIFENARLHGLRHLGDIFGAAYWPQPYPQDLYRPLTSFLLALQWWGGGGEPILFRAMSYIGYALASVAVLWLARRFLPVGIALAIALLFAVHPVHVEAVALGVNQAELAVALLAVISVGRYVDRRRADELGTTDWLGLVGFYAVACLFKESALIIPGLLIAAEALVIDGEGWNARARRLWPGYAGFAAIAAAVILLRTRVLGGQVVGTFTAEALIGLGIGSRALTMLQVIPHWLRLLMWPAHLSVDYSPGVLVAARSFGAPQALGVAVLLLGGAAIWLTRKRAPLVAFGLIWTGIALLPVSNVVVPTGILLAERSLFLPSVGFLLAVGGAIAALADWNAVRKSSIPPGVWRTTLVAGGCALVLAGAARSMQRHTIWRNNRDLWVASAVDAPKSWRVQNGLAGVLFNEGQPHEGILAYERAIAESPEPWSIRIDLARRLRELRDVAGSRRQLELSLAEHADQPDARAELAAVLLEEGSYGDAKNVSENGVQMYPSLPVFAALARLADSAAFARAPVGSIAVAIRLTDGPAPGP